MLGPECWSIRVACSPGANCLEDLIHWPLPSFPLLWCQPRSLTSTLHPLAMGGGHSRCPISVLMTLQSPIIKHIDWTSSTCRERAPPLAKVLRNEAWHTQRRDQASGVSLKILEHLPPKPESAYFMLCAFTYTSDFTGGCPPLPLWKKLAYSSS